MDKENQISTLPPIWYDKKKMNEPLFCQFFLTKYKLAYNGNAFFTVDGMLSDLSILRRWIFDELKPYISSAVSKKVENILNLLKIQAYMSDLPPQTDRIHVLNGTLFLDGTITEEKNEIVRNRFPVRYNTAAQTPDSWLHFLSELLWPEDIPTVQEFIGYCLIPSNAGQKMMLIKGNGGEGKSQIGNVLSELFGLNTISSSFMLSSILLVFIIFISLISSLFSRSVLSDSYISTQQVKGMAAGFEKNGIYSFPVIVQSAIEPWDEGEPLRPLRGHIP